MLQTLEAGEKIYIKECKSMKIEPYLVVILDTLSLSIGGFQLNKRLALIITITFLSFLVTGCDKNVFMQNEKIEEKTKKEDLSKINDKEPLKSQMITVNYWLGEAGEKTSTYTITTEKNESKALLNDRGDCLFSGFEDYDIMLNLVFTRKDGKWGLYNQAGARIIDHIFDEVLNPEMPDGYKVNGLVRVKENGLWGAVDQDGNIIIKPQFDYIHLTFYEEAEPFIKVEKNKKYGYLTANGKTLVDTVWDDAFMDIFNVSDDIIFVKQGRQWGGIKVEKGKAVPVDWNLQPSEESIISFKKWKYAHQHDFYINQIENGKSEVFPVTIIFFNDYFNQNSVEFRSLPVFTKEKGPDWDQFTKFIYERAITAASDIPVSMERFDEIAKKYFGNISYTHKSSSYLMLKDGVYTVKGGWSEHGSYIYELLKLEKGKTENGKDKWKANIKAYYFNELDGTPNEPLSEKSKNAQAVWRELEKEKYKGLNFWEMRDRLVYNNPDSILDPKCEWIIEFMINEPAEDVYFTYLSCEKN